MGHPGVILRNFIQSQNIKKIVEAQWDLSAHKLSINTFALNKQIAFRLCRTHMPKITRILQTFTSTKLCSVLPYTIHKQHNN